MAKLGSNAANLVVLGATVIEFSHFHQTNWKTTRHIIID